MKPLIAANWKMNMDLKEPVSFIRYFKKNDFKSEVVICPPFYLLNSVYESIKKTNIKLGAQNMHFEEKGAFTGEISPLMLKDAGCEYVILGHSERRQYFDETDGLVNKKIKAALKHKLKPILCVGETLEQRNSNKTKKIIKSQLDGCLNRIKDKSIVIAYEPIWAIGTGMNATPEQAEEVHNFIKNITNNGRIIYGGSVKPANIKGLMQMKNINGALVGGASLDAKSFAQICNYGTST
jgi:triosephosphate isomerase (TIM)